MHNDIKVLSVLEDGVFPPMYTTAEAAGADLAAKEGGVIDPGEVMLFGTGVKVAIPHGIEMQIRPRSGLAVKHKVTVVNAPGTIDADYRGEVKVALINLGKEPFEVKKGDRIAQAVYAPVYRAHHIPTAVLDETGRGAGGFGHTG
jgi:dUTP pyrophosphatase